MASLAILPRRIADFIPAISTRSFQTAADSAQPTETQTASGPFTIRLHDDTFRGYKTETPSLDVEVNKEMLIDMYRKMTLVRRMEMAADVLYGQNLIRGYCHLSIGQEAVSVGMESAITPEDRVITSYRCHPFAVLRGGTIKGVLAEFLGRQDGNGIVGAQVPLGAGLALAQQYSGKNDVATFALYGDGASNQGQVFEAFNMAKLWNLPCIFVCENNKYSMSTPTEQTSANTAYYTRGDSIPGIQVNAMNTIAVHQSVKFAKQWVSAGKGPLLMEYITYRYGGHSVCDPGTAYRTHDEVQKMLDTQDPIHGLQQYIEDWGIATESELKAIDDESKVEVDKAVEEANASPEPDTNDLWTNIYYKGTEPSFMRGREKEEGRWF